jgi:phospholipid-binding lipoprotein MlaA
MKKFLFFIMMLAFVSSTVYADDFEDFEESFEDEFVVEEKYDPLEGYNRFMTQVNDRFYIYVFDPAARTYKAVIPQYVRNGMNNMFHNLLYPVRALNNLLQGKFQNTAEESARFVINTTFGLFGFFDPAEYNFGLRAHNEDFGQTLGYYGVKGGFPVVLPILGPSNLRDMFTMYPDSLTDPIYNNRMPYKLSNGYRQTLLLYSLDKINKGSFQVGMYEKVKADAIDLYPYLRDAYEQSREKLIQE